MLPSNKNILRVKFLQLVVLQKMLANLEIFNNCIAMYIWKM